MCTGTQILRIMGDVKEDEAGTCRTMNEGEEMIRWGGPKLRLK